MNNFYCNECDNVVMLKDARITFIPLFSIHEFYDMKELQIEILK